jgi:hypothetical protein
VFRLRGSQRDANANISDERRTGGRRLGARLHAGNGEVHRVHQSRKETATRWRKFSPIDRDDSIFELVADDVIILDLKRSESGGFEVTFHEGASGKSFDLATLLRLIETGKSLVEVDIDSDGSVA